LGSVHRLEIGKAETDATYFETVFPSVPSTSDVEVEPFYRYIC